LVLDDLLDDLNDPLGDIAANDTRPRLAQWETRGPVPILAGGHQRNEAAAVAARGATDGQALFKPDEAVAQLH
jgi:hypothetical protein